jgi:hypothetical protein
VKRSIKSKSQLKRTRQIVRKGAPTGNLPPKDLLGRERVIGLNTVAGGVNPKDKIGAAKVDMTLLSTHAKLAWALAQMDGATKYGPYNWRIEPVQARTYLSAAYRHLDSFLENETDAPDSLIPHLGHVMACCAILIDAMTLGKMVDDRPVLGIGSKQQQIANAFIKNEKPEGWGR